VAPDDQHCTLLRRRPPHCRRARLLAGLHPPDNASALACKNLWFIKSEATDNQIRERFGALVEDALAGRLDAWAGTALGRLALIVLLDQFTRNLFRARRAALQATRRRCSWRWTASPRAMTGMPTCPPWPASSVPAAGACRRPGPADRSVAAFQALADQAGDTGGGGARAWPARWTTPTGTAT
jgi:hypothetical protein